MKAKRIGAGTLIGILLLAVAGFGANDFEIRVHLINGRTGKPVPHKPMQVWDVRPRRPAAPGTVSARPWRWRVKTDGNGVAIFRLPGPPDYTVLIHLGMGGYWEECSGPAFRTSEIVTHGVVNNRACPSWVQRAAYHFEAKPGDVYFFAAHLSLWERIKHCNEWGCNK